MLQSFPPVAAPAARIAAGGVHVSETVTLALAGLFFGLFGITALGMAGAALVGLLNAVSPGASDFGAKALVAGVAVLFVLGLLSLASSL